MISKQSAIVAESMFSPLFSTLNALTSRRLLPLFYKVCEYVADVDTRTTLDTLTVRSKDTENSYARLARLAQPERSDTKLGYVAHIVATLIRTIIHLTDGVDHLDPEYEPVGIATVSTPTTLSPILIVPTNNERALCVSSFSPSYCFCV